MEEVEERNEDGGCHEDQEFLFVIIIHVDFLFPVNDTNDVGRRGGGFSTVFRVEDKYPTH